MRTFEVSTNTRELLSFDAEAVSVRNGNLTFTNVDQKRADDELVVAIVAAGCWQHVSEVLPEKPQGDHA